MVQLQSYLFSYSARTTEIHYTISLFFHIDFRPGVDGSHGDLRPISSVINWKSMVKKYLDIKGIDLGTTPQEGSQED